MTKDQEIARLRKALEKIATDHPRCWSDWQDLAREALSESPASPKGVEPKEMGKSMEFLPQERSVEYLVAEHAFDVWFMDEQERRDKAGEILSCGGDEEGILRDGYVAGWLDRNRHTPLKSSTSAGDVSSLPTPSSTPVTSLPSEEKHQKGELPVSHAEKGSEDAPLDFTLPLETFSGDPVKYICADVIEYQCARVSVDEQTGIVYSSPYRGLRIRNRRPSLAPTVLWENCDDDYFFQRDIYEQRDILFQENDELRQKLYSYESTSSNPSILRIRELQKKLAVGEKERAMVFDTNTMLNNQVDELLAIVKDALDWLYQFRSVMKTNGSISDKLLQKVIDRAESVIKPQTAPSSTSKENK